MSEAAVRTENLDAWYGDNHAVQDVSVAFEANTVTALIGPSGCGKSTFLRCINRLHETIRIARVGGRVYFEGDNVYGDDVDPVLLRRRIGMVFQKPNPFPAMTIRENVLAGLTLTGVKADPSEDEVVERALRAAALWAEVKDALDKPGRSLSGGQQQRLCIARAIAVDPSVILMDEPCSALDPIATGRVEETIAELKETYTLIVVTHNMAQARRISSKTAYFLHGQLIEFGETEQIFENPEDERTSDYIEGRFG